MSSTILIVDDNEKNRKLLDFILKKAGYETLKAENGASACGLAKKQMPHLVLMDIQMPVMDGVTALNAILADKQTRNIPVIAVTSYAMRGDRERLLEQGFVDYISKPIKVDEVLQSVKTTLERRYE